LLAILRHDRSRRFETDAYPVALVDRGALGGNSSDNILDGRYRRATNQSDAPGMAQSPVDLVILDLILPATAQAEDRPEKADDHQNGATRSWPAQRRTSPRTTEKQAQAGSKAQFAGWTLDLLRRVLYSPSVDLTRGEFDLLAAFVKNPNQVLTRDRLLDREAGPEDRTIDVQVLRRALGSAAVIPSSPRSNGSGDNPDQLADRHGPDIPSSIGASGWSAPDAQPRKSIWSWPGRSGTTPPEAGKLMLAARLPGILAPLDRAEARGIR
jgi:hypothetical protein